MKRTGFPAEVAELILVRSEGCCEVMSHVCGYTATDLHHRRARGMGGTSRLSSNWASNGVAICRRCHMYVESERTWSLEKGFLVPQEADPADEPIHWRLSEWVLLTENGGKQRIGNQDITPIF